MFSNPFAFWMDSAEYAIQHSEPVLNRIGLITRRHTSELNHALNRLDRQLEELEDNIDLNQQYIEDEEE